MAHPLLLQEAPWIKNARGLDGKRASLELTLNLRKPMYSVEIIHIRLFRSEDHTKMESVFSELQAGSPSVRACLFRHSRVDNDWSVHLLHPMGSEKGDKSALGRRLADSFESIGLVQHSVWTPVWFTSEIVGFA